jgi:hypothetical protein
MAENESGEMIYSLMIKFCKEEEHIKQLQAGIFFCNTLSHFNKTEHDAARHDPNEGVKKRTKMNNGILEFRPENSPNEPWRKLKFQTGELTEFHKGNIFCMSRFIIYPTIEVSKLEIDIKFNEFGDHYLIIMNQPEFYERLQLGIKKAGYKASGNMVEYMDLTDYKDERSPFIKGNVYAWQNEYRMYFDTCSDEPMKINIGDISDISATGRLSKSRILSFRLNQQA